MNKFKSLEEARAHNIKASKLIVQIEKQEKLIDRVGLFQSWIKKDAAVRLYSERGLDIALTGETKELMLKIMKARLESKKYKLTKELDKLMEV